MDPPFWTTGPVPFQLLDALALERREAMRQGSQILRDNNFLHIGGAPGSGRSTLSFQIALSTKQPLKILNCPSLLSGEEEEHILHLLPERLRRRHARDQSLPEPTWEDVRKGLGKAPPMLVIDDPPDPEASWIRELPDAMNTKVILVSQYGDVEPDAIGEDQAMDFLQRRSRRIGVTWEDDALEEATRLVEGDCDALQQIGQESLHAALVRTRSRIDEGILLEGAFMAAHHLAPRHASRIARLQGARLSLLKAMARNPDSSPTEWAAQCDLPQKSTVVHLSRLWKEDRLIERTGWGRYRIRSRLISMHLQGRYGSVIREHSP